MPFSKQSQFYIFSDKQFVLHIKSVVLTSYTVGMGFSFVLANHNA